MLGVTYGLEMLSLNLSSSLYKHFWISCGVGMNFKKHNFTDSIVATNAIVEDISTYSRIGSIKSNSDSLGPTSACFNIKLGWLFLKPFVFILNVGYNGANSQVFQNVYQAKHNYISTGGNEFIRKNEYFTDPTIYIKGYNSFTFGVVIPIVRRFYIGVDYCTNSEVGKGLLYTAGIMFYNK